MTRLWDSLIGKWPAFLAGTRQERFIVRLDCMILHFGKIYMTKMPLILEGQLMCTLGYVNTEGSQAKKCFIEGRLGELEIEC